MDINDLKAWLTEGLTPEQAAVVNAAIDRDSVKTRAAGLRQQAEYDQLNARAEALRLELDGTDKQPGTKAYQKWYADNYAQVKKLEEDNAKYAAKYGAPDSAPQQQPPPTQQYTEADIQRMVDARIQQGYAPRWSDLLTSSGQIIQKHMFAGRKTPIDFPKVSELAAKYNGNLELAYDEWDKPERDKAQAATTEKEIQRRVDEEIAKWGGTKYFPAGADATPGALSARPKAAAATFDSAAMDRDLMNAWVTGGESQAS